MGSSQSAPHCDLADLLDRNLGNLERARVYTIDVLEIWLKFCQLLCRCPSGKAARDIIGRGLATGRLHRRRGRADSASPKLSCSCVFNEDEQCETHNGVSTVYRAALPIIVLSHNAERALKIHPFCPLFMEDWQNTRHESQRGTLGLLDMAGILTPQTIDCIRKPAFSARGVPTSPILHSG